MPAFELQIEDIAFGGKGVARHEGKAVFVPFTIERERVTAHLTREKKKFAEAELDRVIEAAPERTQPRCPYFGRCGGCAYQHINYEHQLTLKTRQAEQALRRIGKLTHVPMRPIIASPFPYEYRNRITVHALDGIVGFYRRDAHELMDITHCPISRPEVNAALARLRDRRVRDGHFTLRANPGPRVFEQTNDAVADALRELIAGFFPESGALLVDAYCGAGFFAKRLATKFERVIGIDWDRFAVAAAQADKSANEEYLAGDVSFELQKILGANTGTDIAVIVDPPSTGLDASSRAALMQFAPQTLVYVSCNPATLARDLGELQSQFTIESVTPVDMFPQTAEIEVAVHLRKR